MPSTLVHAGLALLLAVAVLDAPLDRRAVAVVLLVMVLPELDTAAGLVVDGAHRALGHNLVLPAVVGLALWYDTRVRDRSWLRGRVEAETVGLAWVALFVYVCAAVGLDYAHLEGVNPLYPLYDRFFRLGGDLYLSSSDGLVQTFVEVTSEPTSEVTTVDAGTTGTTETVHVDNPVQPDDPSTGGDASPDGPPERLVPITVWGWQLYLVCLGVFAVLARRFQRDRPPEDEAGT